MIDPLIYLRETLREEDLLDLISGQALAIRVKNYYPLDLCRAVTQRVLTSTLYGDYANAPIGRVGRAFCECTSPESRAEYYEQAVPWARQLRNELAPYRTPIDQLQIDLDETWRAGALVAARDGKKMFRGLFRVFGPGSAGEAHQDVLSWDAFAAQQGAARVSQLAANIYLSPAAKGGGLALYGVHLDREEYERNKIAGSYGVHPAAVPRPAAVLEPQEGELIIFDPRLIHGIEPITDGRRVSCSCFVDYSTPNEPLKLWS